METKVAAVDPKSFRREDLLPPARALAEGGLVAWPTETVYAIGARRDDPAAVERLGALAPAAGDAPPLLIVQAPTAERALALAAPVPPRALPLLKRFWPGPLTVALPGKEGGEVALRVPASPLATELLAAAGVVALTLSGAAASAEGPLRDAAAVRRLFDGALDWIVDGGATPLKEPSTIVRVTDRGWECLRPGIVSEDILARYLTTAVVFVCTGNSCRSPMAEALLRRKLARRLGVDDEDLDRAGFRVLSAGTAATRGAPATETAVAVMQDRAIDLGAHRSRPITLDLVEEATVVFAMTPAHAQSIAGWWPEHRERVVTLDVEGISDPIGGPPELYRECADHIERRLDEVVEKLLRGEYTVEPAKPPAHAAAPEEAPR